MFVHNTLLINNVFVSNSLFYRTGHAMKLTYFVSPYDLLDKEKGASDPLTVESVTSKNLGYSVTVCIEGSTSHKLQTSTIISVNRNMNGKK